MMLSTIWQGLPALLYTVDVLFWCVVIAHWDPSPIVVADVAPCDSGLWAPHDTSRLLMSWCDHLFSLSQPVVCLYLTFLICASWLSLTLQFSEAWPVFFCFHQHSLVSWVGRRTRIKQKHRLFLKAIHQSPALSDSFACVIVACLWRADECGSCMCVFVQHICMWCYRKTSIFGLYSCRRRSKGQEGCRWGQAAELGMVLPQCTKVQRRWKSLIIIKWEFLLLKTFNVKCSGPIS